VVVPKEKKIKVKVPKADLKNPAPGPPLEGVIAQVGSIQVQCFAILLLGYFVLSISSIICMFIVCTANFLASSHGASKVIVEFM
jgi:hypothetical protein